ncbi:neurogenic locus notch homolog protein 1-like isoform X30 [Mytilus edulis]|uniref:neurogenic locus notch homolog protein 1-like isoform X30 n=1 Tax=Mytilus edulis TaxID=6550 RepID=UPI0039EEB872
MAQRILIILVILSVLFILSEGHWWRRHRKRPHRHCPSRDDEDHVCCDWELKTYQQTIEYCRKCQVTPTDPSDICYYRKRYSYKIKQGCVDRVTYNVTESTCTPKCCDGWTFDEYGQCSIKADANTQEIVCENGGSPAGDYCSCPNGFSGTHCESAVCTPHCLNNGICSGRDGEAVCVCPDGRYTGKQCETPVCNPACQNGGSCIDGIYRPMCSCPPGYEGESCEKEVKDGDCPAASGAGICAEMCKTDSGCPNEQKCCRNGCGAHECTAPAATTCTYQSEHYPVGHRRQQDSCTTCLCKDPNSKQQWECVSISCPRLSCYRTKMIPNLCCPVCDDYLSTTTMRPPTTKKPAASCYRNGTNYVIGSEIRGNNGCDKCICGYYGKDLLPTWTCSPAVQCLWFPSNCTNITTVGCCPTCADVPSTKAPSTTTSPPRNTCTKEGIEYPEGSEVGTDSCNPCICIKIGEQNPEWTCRIVDCPQITCLSQKYIPGQCCPVCDDKPPDECGPICKMFCENGFQTDERGCPICKCKTTTTPPAPTKVSQSCIYNGEVYPLGHNIWKTDCMMCTCFSRNRQKPNWSCMINDCQQPKCSNPVKISGQCCPVCPDTTPPPTTVRPTLPPNTGPSFKHCPSGTLIINTHREKFIDIRRSVNLTVVDNSGKTYKIQYSKEIIEAVPCSCGKNIHIITAQSHPPDQYGRFASCHITVHVVDNHPPMYSTCPSEISAFEDEIISWDKPEASDNVGIKKENFISDYENNSKFPEGSHLLMYVAVDHEGNVAACRFLVAVYKRGSSDPTMPNQLKRDDEENKKDMIILPVIGVLAVLILIIAIILTAMCCRRLKKKENAHQNGSEQNAYDNAIYSTATPPRTPPPSYSKTGGMKLPPKYVLGDEKPPLYEEMDVKVFMKKGVQNPVYDSSDELEVGKIKLRMKDEADA